MKRGREEPGADDADGVQFSGCLEHGGVGIVSLEVAAVGVSRDEEHRHLGVAIGGSNGGQQRLELA
jgi:hypothetical protein